MELLEQCSSCLHNKKLYIKNRKICRSCYNQEYKKRGINRECIDCKNIGQTCKGRCHTCYERKRRNKLIEEAKNNPEKTRKLKLYYRSEYIKSKSKGFYNSLSRRVSSAIFGYRNRDSNSDIDEQWFLDNIVEANCVYCGISDKEAKELYGQYLNTDKKVPELGYKKTNCVPACKACNTAKLNIWSFEEAKHIGKLFKELLEKRKQEV